MPIANGVHWLTELARVRPGETVLVIGPGPQGLAVTAVAGQLAGVRTIVAGLPADAARLELAEQLGATTVAGDAKDVIAAVRAFTGGAGAEVVVIATSGATSVLQTATRCVQTSARIVLAGTNGWQDEQGFKTDALIFRGLQLIGAPGHSWRSVAGAVRLIEDNPAAFEPLCDAVYGLDELPAILDRRIAPGRGVHIGIRPS